MKCTECPVYKDCRRKNDLRRKRSKCAKAKDNYVPTNADRIRAMTDEELAEEFNRGCPPFRAEICYEKKTCERCWIDWLKQPCGEEGEK